MTEFLHRARRIADDVLFPAALDVELSGLVPDGHFRLLAEEGCYGIVAPAEIGGAGLDLTRLLSAIEILAGGCLSTAFVWLHHHGVLFALADTDNTALWAEYLGGLTSGRLRGGVAVAGAVAQPPTLLATRVDGGYRIDGCSPRVAGWDGIDLLLVSASDSDGDVIVTGLVERAALDDVDVRPHDLPVGAATGTVTLTFTGHHLPDERVTRVVRPAEFAAGRWFVSRVHGSLSLGVAGRCVRLLAAHGRRDLADIFDCQLSAARGRLDAGLDAPDTMPTACAEVGELAYRVAGATALALAGAPVAHHAHRLVRAALFALSVARPEVVAETVTLLGRSPALAVHP